MSSVKCWWNPRAISTLLPFQSMSTPSSSTSAPAPLISPCNIHCWCAGLEQMACIHSQTHTHTQTQTWMNTHMPDTHGPLFVFSFKVEVSWDGSGGWWTGQIVLQGEINQSAVLGCRLRKADEAILNAWLGLMCEAMAVRGRPVPLEVRLTRHQQQFKDNGKVHGLQYGKLGRWMGLSVWVLQAGDDQAKVHHIVFLILIGHNTQLTSCITIILSCIDVIKNRCNMLDIVEN